MALIDVSVHDLGWQAVRKYIEARRSEILDEMLSLSSEDRDRRDAAVRMDELALLLRAPEETRSVTESLQSAGASGIY